MILRTLVVALLLLPVAAQAQQPNVTAEREATVAASGEGVVQAVPDRAWITIGAESRASTAREAQKRNTEAMTPVLDKLKAAGISAEAIRTVQYDLQYEWDLRQQQAASGAATWRATPSTCASMRSTASASTWRLPSAPVRRRSAASASI